MTDDRWDLSKPNPVFVFFSKQFTLKMVAPFIVCSLIPY
jgi:hypothetical protein